MLFQTNIKPIVFCFILFCLVLNLNGQTSISLKSQWLDPTNLFTEEKPTAEFNTTIPIGQLWSVNFYYAHDIENLTPIYLIGGINNTRESLNTDSLIFASIKARTFSKYSRNIFVSYQFSETINQLSWIQPIVTWNWNFIKNPSKSIHTFSAEVSGWMSIQRGDEYQDGGYINARYNYAKHLQKWIFNVNLSSIAVKIFEPADNTFVLGQVLSLSSTFIPFNTTFEFVLNKPLITKGNDDFGFTFGLTKEF